MTIINSVIIGGGSGDEVEAYALGDAKNAVKDDKVTLNFSVNMATIEPSLSQGPSGSPYYPGAVSLVAGKYLYTLNTVSSSTTIIRWEKDSDGNFVNGFTTYLGGGRNTYTKPIGPGVRLSYYGRIHQFTEFGNVFDVVTSGSTDSGYVCGSMSQDGNVIMAQNPSNLSPILLIKESGLFIKNTTLQNPNGVEGFWAFTGKKEGSKYYAYVTGRGNTGLKYVCLDAANATIELLSTHPVPSISEYYKSPVCFKDKLICYNYSDSYKAEVFTFTDDGSLTYSEEDSASLRAVVSRNSLTREVGFVQDGYLICSNTTVGYNQTRIDYKEGRGFFEVASPFQDKEGGNVNYIGDGYAMWCDGTTLPGNSGHSFLRRYLAPIEQSYIATEPITGQFYANQTLTGIVQENDNGILKVSTVEDHNNPPPAVPDEAGLKTVINYGSSEGVNGEVSGALTVSPDASVSGFYGNAGAVVRAKNPFVDYSGTINSFEVVIPATMTASDSNYHMLGYFGENSSGNMGLLVYYSGRWILRLKFEGDSNYTDLNAGSSATLNTKTLVKVTYDSSTGYTLWLSTDDGGSWTNSGASTTTKRLINRFGDFVIGGETSSTDGWRGSIDFKGLYVKINNEEVYNGIAPVFGSVGVGYGYFKNTYFYPLGGQASKDKYVPYEGGLLTENDIWPKGSRATTMNIVLGRNADLGSWTSDTKGYLSTQEAVAAAVSKKLPTPVYLWHDLSYITPAVPETIEAVVETGGQTETPSAVNGTIEGSPTIGSDFSVSGFSSSNYIQSADPFRNKDVTSFETVLAFSVPSDNVYQILMIIINALTKGRKTLSFDVAYSTSLLAKVETVNGQSVSISCGAPTAGKKTWLKLTYDSSSGYAVYTSYDGISYTMTGSDTITDKPDVGGADIDTQTILGANLYPGAESQYTRGTIYLPDCYININGQRVWDGVVYEISKGSVSIPTASWKTLDGVVYEYPNGFPKTQAGDLLDDNAVREGSNNLYVTKTGDSCGLVISTSPYGVGSSAVIGTVELDANGAITSFTPEE